MRLYRRRMSDSSAGYPSWVVKAATAAASPGCITRIVIARTSHAGLAEEQAEMAEALEPNRLVQGARSDVAFIREQEHAMESMNIACVFQQLRKKQAAVASPPDVGRR